MRARAGRVVLLAAAATASELQAVDLQNVLGTGTSVDVSIAPTFLESAAAGGLAVLLIGATIAGLWRLRVWQVHRRFALLLSERVRLSNEIHDTLLQGLVGAGLQCDAIQMALGPSETVARMHLRRLRETIDSYIEEARHAIHDLRSPLLAKTDLVTALRQIGERAAADGGIDFDFKVNGDPASYSAKVAEQLLRIGQEAVLNAVRHAHARHVRMALAFAADSLTLQVRDDGQGLAVEASDLAATDHYGLMAMRERAESIGGRLGIVSWPGQGTEVEAVVPRDARA